MSTLDLSEYPIDSIDWSPTQTANRKRNAGGRFRGVFTSALFLDFTVDIAALPYQQAREFEALLESFEGAIEPFELILPLVSTPSGTANTIDQTTITAVSSTQKTLVTTGWPMNTPNIFLPGDLVRLTSLSKIYKVAKAVSSDASGQATIEFTRPILSPAINGEALIFNPARFMVTLSNPAQKYKIPNTKQTAFELDFEETVQ